jgi:hypothetical protein
MSFSINETVILTDKAAKGLPMRVGSLAKVIEILHTSVNYDYDVQFSDGEIAPVRECELKKLTDIHKKYLEYIYEGNEVGISDTKVKIVKVDYFNGIAEIEFDDQSCIIEYFEKLYPLKMPTIEPIHIDSLENNKLGYFEELGLSIGKLVDQKQRAYGDSVTKCYEIMKVLLQDYKNEDNTYTIPESLLPQMLLEVRKIDKMNRRFSNPDGDLMGENPFQDDVGYSMLGVRLIEELKNND